MLLVVAEVVVSLGLATGVETAAADEVLAALLVAGVAAARTVTVEAGAPEGPMRLNVDEGRAEALSITVAVVGLDEVAVDE